MLGMSRAAELGASGGRVVDADVDELFGRAGMRSPHALAHRILLRLG